MTEPLTARPAVLSSYDEALSVARELGPRLKARIPQAEQLRRLPDDTVADLLESGLCGVMKPKRFGGSELGAETLIDASVELAAHCASSGWVYMLWAAHMWLLALWPPAVQEEMFADPGMVASSVVSTAGEIERVEGGYRWSGRGFFSSGVDHCQWLTAAINVRDGETGAEERKWFLIPRADFEIIDDWHVVGLRGTGSKTLVVTDVFIPAERVLDDADIQRGTSPGRAINRHPMYGAISQANFTAAMGAPAVGAARGLLAAYAAKLRPKAASATTSMARFAAVSAQVDAVHALTLQNAQRFSRVPAAEVGPDGRAKCRRDYAYAAQQSRQAANTIYEECGGSGLAESSDLQRIWRDANAAAAHHGLTWDWQADLWPRAAFGLPVPGVNALPRRSGGVRRAAVPS
jgi:alkylation response protein AidB-like acyl-CoA dehydrogenase